MAFYTPLPHRALVAVRGEDRWTFLQGLISNDVSQGESGRAVWAALLTPQGKFLHEFFVVPHGDIALLECERARRDDLVTRLGRYKLRAKVSVAADDTLAVGAAWGDGVTAALKTSGEPGATIGLGSGIVYADPRLAGAGLRWALAPADAGAQLEKAGLRCATPELYDGHRLALGLPDGSRDLEVEKALLLESGFEELHGVDFKKGCYIGQELTARTHYRALIKKRLMPVAIDGPAPPPGTALTADGQEAGEMRSAQGSRGLAVVRLEAWHKAKDGVLQAGDARITPIKPAWMTLPAPATDPA